MTFYKTGFNYNKKQYNSSTILFSFISYYCKQIKSIKNFKIEETVELYVECMYLAVWYHYNQAPHLSNIQSYHKERDIKNL